ncbi:hypothetical protein QBC46DRAFT_354278 [Diplogelasinospora grovesii]|uniref:Uncharacterized protein n=1 Tax=Diplogelasinospora grovesii TaxID=303347 RepID=A0AAN6N9M5_9PEZI|nr:hypothetical protein QBC46DRAFT_354278 [Diplogelasinospora grovesii]
MDHDCNSSIPLDYPQFGFDIHKVQDIADNVTHTCPSSPLLWQPYIFTLAAVAIFCGRNWSVYAPALILQCLTSFKVPLLQLLLEVPRPPYGILAGAFAVLHLTGSPIDTIASLLFTISVANNRVQRLSKSQNGGGGQQRHKALLKSLVLLSLDEIGESAEARAQEVGFERGEVEWTPHHKIAAYGLAADRQTKFLPVVGSICLFIGTVGVAYAKLAVSKYNPDSPWHIEIWSIAFSLTVIWAIPAALLGCVVGVPQSEVSARVLYQLRMAVPALHSTPAVMTAEDVADVRFTEEGFEQGLKSGCLPSWRFNRHTHRGGWDRIHTASDMTSERAWRLDLLAIVIVLSGCGGAIWLSWRVPPEGPNCRVWSEISIGGVYIFSFLGDLLISTLPGTATAKKRLHWSMAKDVVATIALTLVILLPILTSRLATPSGGMTASR